MLGCFPTSCKHPVGYLSSGLEKGVDCTHIKFADGKDLGGGMLFGGPTQPECFSGAVSQ